MNLTNQSIRIVLIVAAVTFYLLVQNNVRVEVSKNNSGDEDDNDDDTNVITHHEHRQPRVRFIPYPHKTLGSGSSIQCEWETRSIPNNSSILDFTQQNAYTEGVCIPPTLKDTLHIFSTAEAIECLSSDVQKLDIRVMLSGDSYMKQMYIGLVDILLSMHIRDDVEIKDAFQRNEVLATAQYWMDKRRRQENGTTFPIVQYRCERECYGQQTMNLCSSCINNISLSSRSDDVWVVGVGIHNRNRLKDGNKTVEEIHQFLDTEGVQNRTIYVSPQYYFPSDKYPSQSATMASLYRFLLPNVAPKDPSHPFLDVFWFTKSCSMENCSYDGSHRSRYVERWKAQLLLNTLCEVYY